MTFTTPLAFVLLLVLPLVLYIGWPRQRYRRTRDILSLILRCTIVTLLVLALAGVQLVRSADRLAVIFLVDVSDSVGAAASGAALAQVREVMRDMGDNDLAGVILFGADAQVERAVTASREFGPTRATPQTGNTNIAAAIRLALALFPADAAQRIVIFSDGQQTLGDAEAQAQLAAAAGVEISYVPLTREPTPDVRLTRFTSPEIVAEGEQFDLTLTVESDEETSARIDIFAGSDLILSEQVALRAGVNTRTLTLEGGSPGFRDFSALITPAGADAFYQNNQLATFSQVVGPARVLLVGGGAVDTQFIGAALREAGLTVDEADPTALPVSPTGLAQYDSVILSNVAAPRMSVRQMRVLQTYVRDLGGGLVVVGGPEAFGPGGYFQTPLEETLPVDMQLEDQQRLPQLTIAYLLDRSGSMGQVARDGLRYMDLANEAVIRSLALLQPTDRVAVAVFDFSPFWLAEFQDVGDATALQREVARLVPSGGTNIMAGVRLVAQAIPNEPSPIKHIILVTDGIDDSRGLVELTRDLNQTYGVTLSGIAIGQDMMGTQLLRDMTVAGGGNFHQVLDAGSIPLIFAQETVLASRSYIFEEDFTPTLTALSPIMQGIDALPALRGYVGTTPKVAAQVILRGSEPYRDPVLAAWQYGLGRSVAFTSDATARWGVNWVTWEDFTRFWAQAVRWTITTGVNSNIETRVVMEDEVARIVVDARAADGGFLNGLELLASVVDPTLSGQRVPLRQVAPGRYEATFRPDREGAYLLRVAGGGLAPDGSPLEVSQTNGWVMRYSAEYMNLQGASVLPTLAQITGGGNLAGDLRAAFAHTLQARSASQPVWPLLLLVALLLLPVDIAVRRLLVTRSDLQRLRAAFGRRPQPVPVTDGPATERLSGLFDARNRARGSVRTGTAERNAPEQPDGSGAPAPARTVSALKSRRERSASEPTATERPAAPPVTARPPQPRAAAPPASDTARPAREASPASDAPPASGNIGSRLLQKRRPRDE